MSYKNSSNFSFCISFDIYLINTNTTFTIENDTDDTSGKDNLCGYIHLYRTPKDEINNFTVEYKKIEEYFILRKGN